MSRLVYILIIWPMSRLPMPILYGLSTGLYWIVFRLFGYRKKVVHGNIERSFPEAGPRQVNKIMHDFYRHFFDLMVESLRGFSMSAEEAKRRAHVRNPEILEPYFKAGQDVMLVSRHCNNWELPALSMDLQIPHRAAAVYKRLQNPGFERIFHKSRSRYGLQLIEKREARSWFESTHHEVFAYFFLTDQSPTTSTRVYWTTFLNQDTAVFTGTEELCRKQKMPILFIEIYKMKRGVYEMEIFPLEDNPNSLEVGELTERFTRRLEEHILADPSKWLWTHKRWKRKREKPVGQNEIAESDSMS